VLAQAGLEPMTPKTCFPKIKARFYQFSFKKHKITHFCPKTAPGAPVHGQQSCWQFLCSTPNRKQCWTAWCSRGTSPDPSFPWRRAQNLATQQVPVFPSGSRRQSTPRSGPTWARLFSRRAPRRPPSLLGHRRSPDTKFWGDNWCFCHFGVKNGKSDVFPLFYWKIRYHVENLY